MFGQTTEWGLRTLYVFFHGIPLLDTVGAYGLAIITLTVIIKLILAPLYQLQLMLSRRTMEEQRRIAPELALIRKRYKGDSQKQQAEMMKLYREHGINPLGQLSGCLPAFLQFPILTALYWVFLGNATHHRFLAHFLFIPDLNVLPSAHPLIPGLPIPDLAYLVVPVLAAATTFVQSKMIQQPRNPGATEQEQQAQQMSQQMQVILPLMILYFSVITPAGLSLYWFVSNCVAIIQQYFVTGWGMLVPPKGPTPEPRGKGGSSGKPRRPRK